MPAIETPTLASRLGIPETVTVKEAMNLLHSSRRQIENLMYEGILAYYKPSKNKVLIDARSIRERFSKPANTAVLHSMTTIRGKEIQK